MNRVMCFLLWLMMSWHPISASAQQVFTPCTTNLLFGRWNLLKVAPLKQSVSPEILRQYGANGTLVFFGSDGLSVAANGEKTFAGPWLLSEANGRAIIVFGEETNAVEFVSMEGTNRLHLVPLDKGFESVFERHPDGIPPKSSESMIMKLVGTWRIVKPSRYHILRIFYKEGVYVDYSEEWGFAGGMWHVSKSLWKTSLVMNGDSYSVVFDGTNKWHGIGKNTECPYLEFERCVSSNFGNN